MLKKLSLKGVGPAPEMEVEFAERLTVITGDNGLGKSFILDAVWFFFTGEKFKEFISINEGVSEARIEFLYEKNSKHIISTIEYDRQSISWKGLLVSPFQKSADFLNSPIIYLGSDEQYGVYDPARIVAKTTYSSVYERKEIWNGVSGPMMIPTNGLIKDVATWYYKDDADPINCLNRALACLFEETEKNENYISSPKRVNLQDTREIPFIITPTGKIAINKSSYGIQRVFSLAYALVWFWQEHKIVCDLSNQPTTRSLLLLIDEIETHLHPKWQRKILAAVLEVARAITQDEGFQVQVICTTHSPIVLTGIEPHFDPTKDKLLDLQLTPGALGERGTVELREVDWYKRGTVGNWLTSEMFNVSERSPEAQKAMDEAGKFGDPTFSGEPDPARLKQVDADLRAYLPDTDRFLVRWEYLLEHRGWMRLLES